MWLAARGFLSEESVKARDCFMCACVYISRICAALVLSYQ
jgi:hypothetical protein